MLLGALGVHLHQLWLLWLGCGVIGGFGLGLGYISPVSTLIKWFPDRRGMATGMAIMGFGGGAMIGSPLADLLMQHFAIAHSVGVAPTLVMMALLYLVAMLCGAFGYRVPPPGWQPAGWTAAAGHGFEAQDHAARERRPRAWACRSSGCCGRCCASTSAPASAWWAWPRRCCRKCSAAGCSACTRALPQLTPTQRAQVATIGAAFAGLLSLFNIVGRIVWASLSDAIGRKATYFGLLPARHRALRQRALGRHAAGSWALFVAIFCVILTMYGGGFATIPAYLADLFGTQHVGAIHGRLLTAWSVAGMLGPVVVNYIREYQLDRGLPADQAYNITMYILAGVPGAGLLLQPAGAGQWLTGIS